MIAVFLFSLSRQGFKKMKILFYRNSYVQSRELFCWLLKIFKVWSWYPLCALLSKDWQQIKRWSRYQQHKSSQLGHIFKVHLNPDSDISQLKKERSRQPFYYFLVIAVLCTNTYHHLRWHYFYPSLSLNGCFLNAATLCRLQFVLLYFQHTLKGLKVTLLSIALVYFLWLPLISCWFDYCNKFTFS